MSFARTVLIGFPVEVRLYNGVGSVPETNEAQVLVVDDNEMNRDMLSRRLERQGYHVIVAENGMRALELVAENAFDLILLDIMMPKLNGYEVLERLKTDQATRHIPIIMISAVDDLDSVVKCIELGAEDYLFKPFNPVLLKARVSASLDKKRSRDQLQAGMDMGALRVIHEQAQALVSGHLGTLTPSQQQAVQEIYEQASQLLNHLGH
jgi:DNA-binding response OmpR family regulator